MSSLTMPSAASDPAVSPPAAAPVDLSDLERHLRSRLALSWSSLELTEGDPSATAATLNSARLEMAELKREVRSTREEIRRWREQLKKAQYLASFLRRANADMDKVAGAMSAHPRLAALAQGANSVKSSSDRVSSDGVAPEGPREAQNAKKQQQQRTNNQHQQQVDKVPFLTVSEFDSVPKYMRGRMTYDSLNAAVSEYNSALEEKYAFLAKGFQAMGSIKDKKRFKEFRSQETRECKGVCFLVADDLRLCPSLKTETNRRVVFTILRHCHRIRELRKPGAPIKYAAVRQ